MIDQKKDKKPDGRDPGSLNRPKSDVLLIIPAYNEAENIERVVDELINDYPQLDYVVVTDGPTDGTDVICKNRGYNMVELPENLGLSGCFRNGMIYAHKSGHKYAVQFDGDGQHRPEYVFRMKEKAEQGYDIVMGSRFLKDPGEKDIRDGLNSDGKAPGYSKKMSDAKSHMSLARRLGSFLIRSSILLKTGVLITDPTCGMRLYDRKIMEMFATKENLAPEPDTIALLIKQGAKVAEVPVRVAERTAGNSYLDPLKAAKYMWRILGAIFKIK